MFNMLNTTRIASPVSRAPVFERSQRRPIVARYACNKRTMAHAYHIRYKGYLSHGYIKPHAAEQLTDQFDDIVRAPSVVVYDHDTPVGTVRLCSYDPAAHATIAEALPSADLFELTPEKLEARFGLKPDDLRLTEVSKLAKIPEYESDLVITMALFKMLKILVTAAASEIVFVAVRVQHMKLYQRLGFQVIEPPRLFTKDNVVLGLMACRPEDFRSIEGRAETIFREPGSLREAQAQQTAAQFFGGQAVEVFPAPPSAPAFVIPVPQSVPAAAIAYA